MERYGSTATAMLVGAPDDVRARQDAATVTVGRDEIEEALASDAPLELILSVGRDATTPQDVRVAWERSDLETVLAGADAGGVTFSFDRAELARALEQPDFEGHGIREMVLLTVAAASASAAMAASTASGQIMEGTGGGGAAAALVAPGHGEATTASDLAAASAIVPGHDEASTASVLATAAIHDEATPAARGVDRVVPGADEATLASRGIGAEPALSPGHGEATTASSLASIAGIHDEATTAARGIGQSIPGADEATLAARGIETPVAHDEATLVARGIETPAATVDSGTGLELPSLDSGSAAAIGGLAGAGLLILGAAFAARRHGARPA
jgi:hypothetical protein